MVVLTLDLVCTGKHFPEHIYTWPDFPEVYGAHCANCGTDYTIELYAISKCIPQKSRLVEINVEVRL